MKCEKANLPEIRNKTSSSLPSLKDFNEIRLSSGRKTYFLRRLVKYVKRGKKRKKKREKRSSSFSKFFFFFWKTNNNFNNIFLFSFRAFLFHFFDASFFLFLCFFCLYQKLVFSTRKTTIYDSVIGIDEFAKRRKKKIKKRKGKNVPSIVHTRTHMCKYVNEYFSIYYYINCNFIGIICIFYKKKNNNLFSII